MVKDSKYVKVKNVIIIVKNLSVKSNSLLSTK